MYTGVNITVYHTMIALYKIFCMFSSIKQVYMVTFFSISHSFNKQVHRILFYNKFRSSSFRFVFVKICDISLSSISMPMTFFSPIEFCAVLSIELNVRSPCLH